MEHNFNYFPNLEASSFIYQPNYPFQTPKDPQIQSTDIESCLEASFSKRKSEDCELSPPKYSTNMPDQNYTLFEYGDENIEQKPVNFKDPGIIQLVVHQIEMLNSIVKKRMESSEKNPDIDFQAGIKQFEELKLITEQSEQISAQILPPSFRLCPDSRIQVYQMISDWNSQKRLMAESGLGYVDEICGFCKNNNEWEFIYRSHRLKKNGCVVCPILRLYTCPICGANGDLAHTVKYCPKNQPNKANVSQ